jgi:hypothetical protein
MTVNVTAMVSQLAQLGRPALGNYEILILGKLILLRRLSGIE